MADINQADVELTLGVNMMLDNEDEFAEALSNLQNSDAIINVGGVEKSLGNISQQLLTILQSETEITQKSKEMSNALGSNANNIKTFFETTIGQITSKLKETYDLAQKTLDNGKVVEGYSLLQSAKGQAGTLQAVSRKYKESFGELPQIEIGDGLYKSDDLDKFIKDLDKASKAQNEFISEYSILKKQLANTSEQARKDLLNNPAVSSMFKNAIASLGTEFKTLEKDINNSLDNKNYDGLSDKIKELYQVKSTIEELMTQSGIDTVKAKDTPLNISVKKGTSTGVDTRYDEIVKRASKTNLPDIKSTIKQINEGSIKADENIQKLIEDCFRLEQSKIVKNSDGLVTNSVDQITKKDVSTISKEDKNSLKEQMQIISDLGSNASAKNYEELVNIFDKIAKTNFEAATKQFEKLARTIGLLEKDETIRDFEDIYGVSFYKPDDSVISNSTNLANINNEKINTAIEAQKQAEAEAQQYKSQVDNLESQLATKNKELEAINKKVNDLRNQLNKASENSSSERVTQLESEIEKKNKEKTTLESEIKTLRSQLSENKTKTNSEDNSAKIKELQEEVSAKNKENEDLKKINEELQASLATNSSKTSTVNNGNELNNIEQINKAVNDFYNAVNNDELDLNQQRQELEKIISLYEQLPENEQTNPSLVLKQPNLVADLKEVNALLEEQNKQLQEQIRLANEAKIKESELYQQILKYQKEYDKTQSQDGASLGLNKRKDRKEYQNKLVSAISNKKKKLQEQYPDFSSEEIWSDSKISETKEAISKSLTGLSEKVAYAEEQSLKFVESTNRLFEDYSNKYDQATTSKKKQQVLDEMIKQSNQINNNVVPIEEATQKDLDKGAVATSEAISQMVKKFDDFVLKKQQELLSAQKEVEKTSKVIDQAKNSKKSLAKTDLTTSSSTPQPDSDTVSSKSITSSKDFVETITNRMNKKKNAISEKVVNEENTDFSKLGSSIDIVTNKINAKTEAIKTEGQTVTQVVNGEIGDFERLRKKIEEVTGEVNNKNSALEGSNIGSENKETSKPSKTSEVKSNINNIVDNNVNNINPFKITDIVVTEEAKAKLNTEISNAIATIYISDVKLADGVLLSDLQKEISNALNVNPVEVQVIPNINNGAKEEKTDNSVNGVSINISSISFANEEVASALKARIEDALSPIFIRQVNGENADVSSLENRISLALNVIKIDRVELNENFDVSSLQKEIEKYLSTIKVGGIDTSELAQSIKTEIETALAQLKVPKVGTKVKFTDADQTKFDKLTKAIDKFSEAIERKNQAVDSFIGNEAANIEVLLGKIKELKEVLDSIGKVRVLYERDVSKDTDSNTGTSSSNSDSKKDNRKITGIISGSDTTSIKQDTGTKDKKEVATQKEKKKLLEEELKIKTKIAKIEYQRTKEQEKQEPNRQKLKDLKAEKEEAEKDRVDLKTNYKDKGITEQDIKDFIEIKFKKIGTTINNEQNAINKGQKNIGINKTEEAKKSYKDVAAALEVYTNSADKTIEALSKLKGVTQGVIESNQAARDSVKNNTGENALNTKYERLAAKMKKWASDNPLAMKNDSVYKKYYSILNKLNDVSNRTSEGITKLEGEFSKLDGQIQETGLTGRTFTGEMKNLFNVLGDRAIVSMVIEGIKDGFRQMINNVKEIDTAMTELKKVTNETSTTYNNFLKEAGSRASDLGATMTDLISSTADFAKLGYSVKDAAVLAENAIMYSNVGDLDIQTATSDIVSALKAFDIEASNATKIVDSFNEVGNNYAISAQQIGEALQNSASSLVVAGNDIDQSIAMITAMTEIECCLHIRKLICFRFLTIEVAQNSETPSGIGQYCG